jgi:ribonuclease BN (tRNA processing enzyme)
VSRLGVFAALAVLVVAMWAASFASRRLETVAAGVAPLEPRRFERLTLVAAGTGGTFENHLRLGPAVVAGLGDVLVLVDAGRGTAQALRRAEIPVAQPRVLLLTSLLPENVLGVDDWFAAGATSGSSDALRIVGPAGTRALVEGLRAAHAAGTAAEARAFGRGSPPALEAVEAGDGHSLAVGPLALRATALPGGPLPGLAWRIEGGGAAAVVSSAGWNADALVAAATGAGLWVHEALYGASLQAALDANVEGAEAIAREAALHTRLEDVGALAARAGVRRLALVRLRPPPVYAFQYQRLVARSFRGAIDIPSDGDVFTP